MRSLGLVLLTAGTIVGSLGGAHLPKASWTIAGVGFALLAIGGVLVHLGDRANRSTTRASGSKDDPMAMVQALPEAIGEIVEAAPELSLDEIRERLTRLESETLAPLSEASPKLLGPLGADRFAEVFGAYASAERSLARAWSAAADNHRPETLASLDAGKRHMTRAAEAAAGES